MPQLIDVDKRRYRGRPRHRRVGLAMNLLSNPLVAGRVDKDASKNAAPRKIYEAKLARWMTATRFRSLFAGSGGFVEAPTVSNDFLVVDEAHRLNQKSGAAQFRCSGSNGQIAWLDDALGVRPAANMTLSRMDESSRF